MSAAHTARGKVTERLAARWFRDHGFPGAERIVRTGYASPGRTAEDEGDISLCPGAIVQVKSLRPVNRAERAVTGWLVETDAQRFAAGAEVALLVVRRDGTADVGEWFAWLSVTTVVLPLDPLVGTVDLHVTPAIPARFSVADAARLLRSAGYGDPIGHEEGTR